MSLTLAEQYLAEAFPQSWLRTVEASELPVLDETEEYEHRIIYAFEEVLEARQESNS
jgi:hypothetical protein